MTQEQRRLTVSDTHGIADDDSKELDDQDFRAVPW